MEFKYMFVQEATGYVDIDDIGHFAISVTNDMYKEWIMIVNTVYGITEIVQYGPHSIDFDELEDKVNYSYQRFEYSESRISKIIDYYINDSSKHATQVSVISFKEAKERIKNIVEFLRKA